MRYSHPAWVFVSLKTLPKPLAPSQSLFHTDCLNCLGDVHTGAVLSQPRKAIEHREYPRPRPGTLEYGSTAPAAAIVGGAVIPPFLTRPP